MSGPNAVPWLLLVAAAASPTAAPRRIDAALAAPTRAESSLSVGVLRRDGLVIPFAGFDGKRWKPIWSAPAEDLDVPIDVRNVPKSWWGAAGAFDAWQAWTGGAEPLTIHVRQPELIPAECLRQIGLRTEYRSAEPPPPIVDHPYPKDGLVVAPPHNVERIIVVDKASPERAALAPAVAKLFNSTERNLEEQHHPIPRSLREATNPVLEAVYSYGSDPRIYYVEAAREYRPNPATKECKAVAFGTGWFTRVGDLFTPVKTHVFVQTCDREAAYYMLPLGVIRSAGRLFWIAQFSAWNWEDYRVIEITPKDFLTVLDRSGGSC